MSCLLWVACLVAQEKPAGLGDDVRVGDVQIIVHRVGVVPSVPLKDSRGKIDTSAGPYFIAEISISNLNENKKHSYAPYWRYGGVRCEDDKGNRYARIEFESGLKRIHMGKTEAVEDTTGLYEGKPLIDWIAFEPPVRGANELRLTFESTQFGTRKQFVVVIEKKWFQKKN